MKLDKTVLLRPRDSDSKGSAQDEEPIYYVNSSPKRTLAKSL
jgi:hypothetical protein